MDIRQRHIKKIRASQLDMQAIGVDGKNFENKQKLSGKSVQRMIKAQRRYDREALATLSEKPGI